MEKCSNCERPIGNLEPVFIVNDAVVCDACHQRLRPPPPPPPVIPTYASPPPPSNAVATLIPYKNPMALTSYYLGIFSLFPCLGAIMGIVAVVLGIKGLKLANAHPEAKGKAHAIVGIICGAIFGGLWLLAITFYIVIIILAAARGGTPR
jgi:hypothetical protein